MDNKKNNNIEELFKMFFDNDNTEETKEKFEDNKTINIKNHLIKSQENITREIQHSINAIKLELIFYKTNKDKFIEQIERNQDLKNFLEFSEDEKLFKSFPDLNKLKIEIEKQEKIYIEILNKHKEIKNLSEQLLESREIELEISKKLTEYIKKLDI